ncbi:MAG: T9SS type A sorting domain-containing protein [Rhodothermales bacterium]
MNRSHLLRPLSLLAALTLLAVFPASAQTLEFQSERINRGPLFAAASLVQDFDADGDLDIVVTRRTRDGLSGAVEWLENDGTLVFARHEIVTDLKDPIHIQRADLDGDGDDDYAVADAGIALDEGGLILLIRQDDGGFVRQDLDADRRFDDIDLEDLDGDGLIDVVGVGFWQDSLRIWINEGDLNFSEKIVDPSVNQLEALEAADVDDDGDIDLLVDDVLYKNDGNGAFTETQDLFTWSALSPSAGRDFVVADLDNDGVLDILTYATVGTGGLYLLDGASGFNDALLNSSAIDLGGDLLVSDLDGNGWKDIVRQNTGDKYVSVLYQMAEGVYEEDVIEDNWDTSGRGAQMALGDLDGDGDDDLVFPEYGNVDGDMAWYENRSGRLYRHYLYSEVQAAYRPLMTDLDGDGDLDVLLAAGSASASGAFSEGELIWYENRSDGFQDWRIEDAIPFPADLDVADLDGDGAVEVIAIDRKGGTLAVYTRDGFDWAKTFVAEDLLEPAGLALGDLNADDRIDIAVVSYGDSSVVWYENAPAGFVAHGVDDALPMPDDLEIADFNGDAIPDLAVVSSDTSQSVVLYTLGEVMTRQVLLSGHDGSDIEVGDWSGDGVPDILAAFDFQPGLSEPLRAAALINQNDGTFQTLDLWPTTNQEKGLALKATDADGDGDLDVFVSQKNIRPALVLLVNDDAATPDVVLLRDLNTDDFTGLDAGDIDGDGDIDLVAAGSDGQSTSIVLFRQSTGEVTAVDDTPAPRGLALYQSFPNPAHRSARIVFELEAPGPARLEVFDVLGRRVASLADGRMPAGLHEVTFETGSLPSGIYMYRLDAGDRTATRTLTVVR